MTKTPDEYHIGQIWANEKREPSSVFLITKLWYKEYEDGNIALRITGFSTHAPKLWYERLSCSEGDYDARSFVKLYPYKFWCPEPPEDTEDK